MSGDGKRFLNLSGGMLALVIAAAIVLPFLCCGILAAVGAIGG